MRSNTCKLGELTVKYHDGDAGNDKQLVADQCKEVFNLLLHLPFVQVSGGQVDSEVSLINPRSISKSTAKDGAAQCFLVIQESEQYQHQ